MLETVSRRVNCTWTCACQFPLCSLLFWCLSQSVGSHTACGVLGWVCRVRQREALPGVGHARLVRRPESDPPSLHLDRTDSYAISRYLGAAFHGTVLALGARLGASPRAATAAGAERRRRPASRQRAGWVCPSLHNCGDENAARAPRARPTFGPLWPFGHFGDAAKSTPAWRAAAVSFLWPARPTL